MDTSSQSANLIVNSQFELVEARESDRAPGWADGAHPLKHHLLLHVARGEGELIINGRNEPLENDSFYVYPPGTYLEIRYRANKPLLLHWIAFDKYVMSQKTRDSLLYTRDEFFPLQGRVQVGGTEIKRRLFLLVSDKPQEGKEQRRLFNQQLLRDLLTELLLHASAKSGNDAVQRLQATIDYMLRHYREKIQMSVLADLGQFHPAYYSQVFKQMMGKTPMAFLTDLRMNKSKEMLLTTEKPISDIAAHVGYGDEFYFSRRFKEKSGYSPSFFTRKSELTMVSLSSPYTDHLFTLGLTPRAAQIHRHIPLKTKVLQLPEHGSEPWRARRELFMELKPDLIVCKDNVFSKAQEQINDIAPIIAIPWLSRDVYQHMESIAELVNQKKLARRWLDDHERKAEEWRKLLKAKIGNRTVALCVCREHELRMYGARNIGHVFYRSLNLRPPEKIAKLMGQFPTGTGYTWTAISPDEIEQYESDYLFVAVEQESDRQRIKHWLDTRPAWSNHPAVRARRLYFLDWEKWMIYAPFVINQQLDEAGSLLAGGSPAGRI